MKTIRTQLTLLTIILLIHVFFPGLGFAKKAGKGYCCYHGKVIASSQVQCKQKGGKFSKSKSVAQQICSPKPKAKAKDDEIFCCLKNKVDKIPIEKCRKNNGTPYKTKDEAEEQCLTKDIYCCKSGHIDKVSLKKCKRNNGKPYESKFQAQKECVPQPKEIYCCLQGKIKKTIDEGCKRRGGAPYLTERKAKKNCGWCCDNNRLISTTVDTCKNKRGKYYTSYGLAKTKCVNDRKLNRLHANGRKTRKPLTQLPVASSGPNITPTSPSFVPLSLDRGIELINPTSSSAFYPGETIIVLYRLSSSEVISGTITFSVRKADGTDEIASTTIPFTPIVPVNLTLPVSIRTGEYKVVAEHSGSSAYGESDDFYVNANVGRIDFFDIESGDEFNPGGSIDIRYKLNHRVEPGPITFQLFSGGAEVASQTNDYSPQPPHFTSEAFHNLHMDIPNDAPYGEYTIGATHPRASGFTPQFTVQPFGEGNNERARNLLEILTPSSGASWMQGSNQTISWRISGDYLDGSRFRVRLVRDGVTVSELDGSTVEWHPSTHVYSFNWRVPEGVESVSGYRIEVTDRDGPAEDTSYEFSIVSPITITSLNETYYFSNPMSIGWRIDPTASVSRVNVLFITTEGDVIQELGRNLSASSGHYDWRVGANLRSGTGWEYRVERGERMLGAFRVRVQDFNHPESFTDSEIFYIELPSISISMSSSGTEGYDISWSALHLDPSVRVNVSVNYFDRTLRQYQSRCIARDRTVPGNLHWHFGDTCDPGVYPDDSDLPTEASFVVYVIGFAEAVARSSADFTLREAGYGSRHGGDL